MNKACLYCGIEMDCKRHSKKYCNDKCKQLAYLKRSNVTLSNSVIEITTNTHSVNNEESEIEKLLNEISIRVLKLQELQKKQSHKNKTTKLCEPVSFAFQKYTHIKE
jgi:hypothetical protein